MKKLIASLLVLVFGATMVMAEVPTVAVNSEQVVASEAAFEDVEGTPLGEAESADVKGKGSGIVGFFVGAIVGGIVYDAANESSKKATGKTIYEHVKSIPNTANVISNKVIEIQTNSVKELKKNPTISMFPISYFYWIINFKYLRERDLDLFPYLP